MADQPEFNHFNEFCKLLKEEAGILSQDFRDKLTVRLSAAMQDAYNRGIETERKTWLEKKR